MPIPPHFQRTLRRLPATAITSPASGLSLIKMMNASRSESLQMPSTIRCKIGVSNKVNAV